MITRKIVAAALLTAALATHAPASAYNGPTRVWWCNPSGMTNLTPLFRVLNWTCRADRPMDR